MHALLILDVVLQVSGTQHQDTNLAGPSKMDVSVSSLALYEKYPLRVLISAKPKTSGLLPDMASLCYKARCARADVCFGVLSAQHRMCGSAANLPLPREACE
jgi:hypothetical protein